jgi:hydroxyacylglutathione hydrolase
MLVHALRYASSANFTYLIADGAHGALVDPSFQGEAALRAAAERGIAIEYVLLTHGHQDHCCDVASVVKSTGCRVAAHPLLGKDLALQDGAVVQLGAIGIRVVHTPGHTPDSICFVAGECLFTGDTLFIGECGRTDLPGGDAGILYDSLFGAMAGLDDKLTVYPGHDYGPKPSTTLGEQRRTNYVMKPRTREEFVRFMREP